MKKYILFLLIILIVNPYNLKAQKSDRDGAIFGALVGAAAVAAAIEKQKELLELLASTYIMTNTDYSQFRVKVIGFGSGGKKLFDEGNVSLIPFGFTELNNGVETQNRKLLLLFASKGWTNEFGVDYSKLEWKFWDGNEWNNLMSKFSEINSPSNISITGNMIPVYKKLKSTSYSKIKDLVELDLLEQSNNIYLKDNNDESKNEMYSVYERDDEDLFLDMRKLKLKKEGWKDGYKLVYPFYELSGDDYIVGKYNDEIKVFANESSLGIHLKYSDNQSTIDKNFKVKTNDNILIARVLLNKIHTFINNTTED
tara:strand:+ start:1336 stop:2268 length:933 start_codon:yes stop_codon:yes gene_type:complete